jgi:hypothetical protein
MRRSLDDTRLVSLDALSGISVAAKIRIERNPRSAPMAHAGRRRSATVTAGESLQTRVYGAYVGSKRTLMRATVSRV